MTTLFILLDISLGFILGTVIGTVIFLPIAFLLICYFFLAKKDLFFTFGHENKAMFVMNGKLFSGKVIFPSYSDYIDEETFDIQHFVDDVDRISRQQPNFFGMYWIGIPPFRQIHSYRQQWQEWQLVDNVFKLIPRDEITKFLITKPFAYGMWLQGAENSEQIPLDLKFTVFVKPTNVVKPVFLNDDAYGQLQDIVLATALLYVRMKTFASFQTNPPNKEKNKDAELKLKNEHDEFSDVLCGLNDEIPGRPDGAGVTEILGYEITGVKINSVEIAGENRAKILEATTNKYVAEQQKEADIRKAQGNYALEKVGVDIEKLAREVRQAFYASIEGKTAAEQIELAREMFSHGLNTFVASEKTIPTIPIN